MAVFLSDQAKPDPGLLEAVKIVIKYEIQALLTKLADTGEEYLVLTASTLDNSCGHIGSVKGESFVKTASLQLIKEEFLNFCTGNEIQPEPDQTSTPATENVQDTVQDSPVVKIESSPVVKIESSPMVKIESSKSGRNRRRKSTPRCKSQPPEWQTQQELQAIQNYAMTNEADSPPIYRIKEEVEQNQTFSAEQNQTLSQNMSGIPEEESENDNMHVLDLSDKNIGGYSYTLDCSSDSYGSNVMSSSSDLSKYPSKEISPKHNGLGDEVLPYTWREEKFPISMKTEHPMMEYVNGSQATFSNYIPKSIDHGFSDESKPLVKVENAARRPRKSTPMSQEGGAKQQRNRRKSRKTPVKTMSNGVVSDATSTPFVDNHGEYLDEKVNTNGLLRNSTDITDMKSAFMEIGNMAKCLICFKVLANKNNRTFHWRSHVGDKRYTCDICNKAFTHPSNMRSHRKIHTDEKPFPCKLCDRRFRRRDYLVQHLERFHLNWRASDSSLLMDESIEGVASGTDASFTDTSMVDTSMNDTSMTDTSIVDTNMTNTSMNDTSITDASFTDARIPNAGMVVS